MSNPKPDHFREFYRIGRCLLGSQDKSLILQPESEVPKFEVYEDADFAGNYSNNEPHFRRNPVCARSRTGFILCYAGAPLLWISKLKSEGALSTTEFEYIVLSHSLRDALLMQRALFELSKAFLFSKPNLIMRCKVFEDNEGAITFASNPKYRPGTKHIAVKYHHFRERVQEGEIVVEKISMQLQKADMLT